MDCKPKPPPRQAVLILSHPDGFVEIFAEKNVDVCLARLPVASSREAEATAEDVAELLLPRRYRQLWRADRLRASGTTRPLLPSAMNDALAVQAIIKGLNQLTDPREQVA